MWSSGNRKLLKHRVHIYIYILYSNQKQNTEYLILALFVGLLPNLFLYRRHITVLKYENYEWIIYINTNGGTINHTQVIHMGNIVYISPLYEM